MKNILHIFIIIILIICFNPAAVAQKLIPKVEAGKIIIDGLSNDWEGFNPVVTEIGLPLDRSTQLMEHFDVKDFFLAYDEANLYFLITLEPGVGDYFSKTQAGGYVGDIYVNSDSNQKTGCKDTYLYGCENITGYDYKIWIPTGVSSTKGSAPFAFVSYKLCPTKDNRKDFSMSEVAEANSMENPTIIQFSGENIEFSISLKLLGIKHGLEIEGIFQEFSNSSKKEGNSKFSFVLE